jgi:hypothetical protein
MHCDCASHMACVRGPAASRAGRVGAAAGTSSIRTRGTALHRQAGEPAAWATGRRSANCSARSTPAPPQRAPAHCLAGDAVHSADRRLADANANARRCEPRYRVDHRQVSDARLRSAPGPRGRRSPLVRPVRGVVLVLPIQGVHFFFENEQRGRFGQCLLLAGELALELTNALGR